MCSRAEKPNGSSSIQGADGGAEHCLGRLTTPRLGRLIQLPQWNGKRPCGGDSGHLDRCAVAQPPGSEKAGRYAASGWSKCVGPYGTDSRSALLLIVFVAPLIYKHLFVRFTVGHEEVAKRMAARELAEFRCWLVCVISCCFE